jgi:hypothetical protein
MQFAVKENLEPGSYSKNLFLDYFVRTGGRDKMLVLCDTGKSV